MSAIKWSEVAADDLQRIAEHIRSYDSKLEKPIVSFIIDRTDILLKFPRLGRPWEAESGKVELRTILAGKRYRIVYCIDEHDAIEILQVLDVRSDNQ